VIIPILDIEQLAPSVYIVHYTSHHGGVVISEPTQHRSISEALAYCGENIPSELAAYVEVQYGYVSSGTTAVARLRSEPLQLAAELVAMVADVAEAHEQQEAATK
jgi:hypothetical protein